MKLIKILLFTLILFALQLSTVVPVKQSHALLGDWINLKTMSTAGGALLVAVEAVDIVLEAVELRRGYGGLEQRVDLEMGAREVKVVLEKGKLNKQLSKYGFKIVAFMGLFVLDADDAETSPFFAFQDISDEDAHELGLSEQELGDFRSQLPLINAQLEAILTDFRLQPPQAFSDPARWTAPKWIESGKISLPALAAISKISAPLKKTLLESAQ